MITSSPLCRMGIISSWMFSGIAPMTWMLRDFKSACGAFKKLGESWFPPVMTTCLQEVPRKGIIKVLGRIVGKGCIENVACDKQYVYLFFLNQCKQPCKKSRIFLISFFAVKRAADVPVGGMQYFHKEVPKIFSNILEDGREAIYFNE